MTTFSSTPASAPVPMPPVSMPGAPSAPTGFSVPRWLRNAHVQTLGARLPLWSPPRSFDMSTGERLRIALPGRSDGDGGALIAHAHFHARRAAGESAPRTTAILVHGVGGSSDSRYVMRAAVSLFRSGMNVVRLNLRGAGDSMAEAPALYHAGLIEDYEVTIAALEADPRVDDIVIVGFSLGGNCALKLAGTWGKAFPKRVRAVAAISPPFDLLEVSRWLERIVSTPYRRYVLKNLLAQGLEFAQRHPARATYRVADLAGIKSIRAYDDRVVAPMHGFASAEAYYKTQSAGVYLSTIEVPTLIVHALDDPMIPERTVRPWLDRIPAHVEVALSDRGGHVGFFGGLGESHFVDTWAMRRVKAFLTRGKA